jgi:hypothetical protein
MGTVKIAYGYCDLDVAKLRVESTPVIGVFFERKPLRQDSNPTVTFYKVYTNAISPMRGDKSGLGMLPTMAYRHCEPVRTACAFGWYVFPPEDIFLRWNGADISYVEGNEWLPLAPAFLPNFGDYWDKHAPKDMKGLAPPFLSPLPASGFVQIWSGLLCATRQGWSVLIRPPANIRGSHQYHCFEGLVEADDFRPFPLFVNIQLLATNEIIKINKVQPLFQVQPLMRETYGDAAHEMAELNGLAADAYDNPILSAADWAGYRNTIRVEAPNQAPESGRYTVATRKRGKRT